MKILHASDFHLDSPFQRLSAKQAMVRRRELRELPARLVQAAKEEQVDLILLPGDLFDGERVYPETIDALSKALGSAGVPVVIAPGNHDCADGRSPYLTAVWPDNVYIFTSSEVRSFDFPELNCTVYGYAFTTSRRTDDPLLDFSVSGEGGIHLLCGHGEVGLGGCYGPVSPNSLSRSGVTYAALGHVHTATETRWEGDTAWAYCGCPEGRGFDECGEKGALIVTIDDNGVNTRFRPLCQRRYRIENADVAQFEQEYSLADSEDLVRIILTGESDQTPDLPGLKEKIQNRYFYVELRDHTTLPRNLWARAEEDTLTGLFLREMRRRLDAAMEEERSAILLATRFGLAALERGEDICP